MLYLLKGNTGVLACFDAQTGKEHFRGQRLRDVNEAFASPVGAADRIYVLGKNGVTQVIRKGTEYELLAQNTLNDSFTASPALVSGEIYLRGHKSLYCLARR